MTEGVEQILFYEESLIQISILSHKFDQLISSFEISETLKISETFAMNADDVVVSILINIEKEKIASCPCGGHGGKPLYNGYKAVVAINPENKQIREAVVDCFKSKIVSWDIGLFTGKGSLFDQVEINGKKLDLLG